MAHEAHYRLSAQILSRSRGHSTVAAAAYRSGSRLTDARTGRTHDYRPKGRSQRVVAFLMVPPGCPAWAGDREELWNALERIERRRDAQLVKEFQLSFPRDVPRERHADLVRKWVQKAFVADGYPADIGLHYPDAHDGGGNPHAHVMIPMRRLTDMGFARTKDRNNNPKFARGPNGRISVAETDLLVLLRASWAAILNEALDAAGSEARADHRSLEARALEALEQGDTEAVAAFSREPEPRVGPAGTAIHDRGVRKGATVNSASSRWRARLMVQAQNAANLPAFKSLVALSRKVTAVTPRIVASLSDRLSGLRTVAWRRPVRDPPPAPSEIRIQVAPEISQRAPPPAAEIQRAASPPMPM